MSDFWANLGRNTAAFFGTLAKTGPAPKQVIIELKGEYPLFTPERRWQNFWQPRQESLTKFRNKLKRLAATDIEGVILLDRNFQVGLADVFAMRQMLDEYRAKGKKVTLYSEMIDNKMLYLASSVDQLVVPEASYWNANGLAARINFLKNTLDKIGVDVHVERRTEYKSFAERFTETDFSPELRESLSEVLGNIFDHWLETVSKKSKLDKEQVKAIIDQAPLLMDEAKEHGLVDQLGYEDELTLEAKPWAKAAMFAPPEFGWDSGPGIAVVALEGAIVDGESQMLPPFPLVGGQQAGGNTIVRTLREAAQDKAVKAIVFYVDSGGGSALASEMIWREIERIKKTKPVIAVMGNTAASGGYYVLCSANKIFASPVTVTGSIGVVTTQFNLSKLWEKLGFSPKTIKFSSNADFLSSDRAMSEQEKEKLSRITDNIYRMFKQRVADGRKKNLEEVEQLAKGRIWSGQKALELGLVDEIGTPFDAILAAKELVGLPSNAPVWYWNSPAKYVSPTNISAIVSALNKFSQTRIQAIMPELEVL